MNVLVTMTVGDTTPTTPTPINPIKLKYPLKLSSLSHLPQNSNTLPRSLPTSPILITKSNENRSQDSLEIHSLRVL